MTVDERARLPEGAITPARRLRLRAVPEAVPGVSFPLPPDIQLLFLAQRRRAGARLHLPEAYYDHSRVWTYQPALCGAQPPYAWGKQQHWYEEVAYLGGVTGRLCPLCAAAFGFDRETVRRLRAREYAWDPEPGASPNAWGSGAGMRVTEAITVAHRRYVARATASRGIRPGARP